MNEEVEMVLAEANEGMENTLTHLGSELNKIRTGRATPSMLGSVMVEYYGTPTPLSQVANVSTSDARTLIVQPWEKPILTEVVKAIQNANLGLNPQNNGEMVIIAVPMLTEERRRDLVKQAKAAGEHSKVGIRAKRKDANDFIKGLKADGLSEDNAKAAEDSIQNMTNDFIVKVDKIVDAKEIDIMKV
jgi:ribosome recycling factor